MTTKQLHRHIRKIKRSGFCGFVMLVLTVLCFLSSLMITNIAYHKWIDPPDSSTEEQKIESIARAINLKPNKMEGYHKILDIYLEDGMLSSKEHARLQKLMSKHQAQLHKHAQDAVELYQSFAFGYLECYGNDPELRLKAADTYLRSALQYSEGTLADAEMEAFLMLENYYSSFIWGSNALRQPDGAQVRSLILQIEVMLDTFSKGEPELRLAYACCVADLLQHHGQLWAEKTDMTTVSHLMRKVFSQEVTTNGAIITKLTKELQALESILYAPEVK